MSSSSSSSEPVRVEVASTAETEALGRRIGGLAAPGDVVLLDGPLGVGKTTLARGIAAGLGVRDAVTSPTYTIVHEHRGENCRLAHLDLYRLETAWDVENLGLDDLLDGDSVLVVEWGGVAGVSFGDDRLEVELRYGASDDDSRRTVLLTARGERWQERLGELGPW